jgi:GAF domain-containing protein
MIGEERADVAGEASLEPGSAAEVLRSLLQVGVNLSMITDFRKMLDMILLEVRRLARAEAGSLYIVRKKQLRFAAAQNDRLATPQIIEHLLGKEMGVSDDSLAGFVASSGQAMNIPNSYVLPKGAPFRINRELDAKTGYRVRSILAIPLTCPPNKVIGILELFNRLAEDGRVIAFPETQTGILSLAAMAAVTIHNALLQEELRKAHLETIIRLSVAAEFRDDQTSSHIRRVSHTSAVIARALDLDPRQVELIHYSSPMHDVGKIGIPDAILNKPGRLTDDERKVIQEHSSIGPEILGDPCNDLAEMAREVALTHHERWDGKGYPKGLAGEEIPLSGRIVAIADVFDALVSKRCYKDPSSTEEALAIIRGDSGKAFDPRVVEAFFSSLDEILSYYRDPAISQAMTKP